jgi:thiosulfate/3-mercaptopyruvate sulfurtransferase
MEDLGISNGDHVVVYDASDMGLYSAARLWWMLRVFGHDRVSVLDGGLAKWRAEGLPTESGPVHPQVRMYESKTHARWY